MDAEWNNLVGWICSGQKALLILSNLIFHTGIPLTVSSVACNSFTQLHDVFLVAWLPPIYRECVYAVCNMKPSIALLVSGDWTYVLLSS
jgi:hypothetical protein